MAKTHNADNERIKRRYFTYLVEARRHGEATVDSVAKALNRFETYTRFRDFRSFHREQAVAFKRALAEQVSPQTGECLSKATLYSTLKALRSFFLWLAGEPGFKSRLAYADADYFNLSDKETRIAKAHREPRVASIEQIRHVLAVLPAAADIEQRDRALIAFTLLTGARDSATASFKLKHIDIARSRVTQDAREVRTKFSKTFTTTFFPVGEDVRKIVADWVSRLTDNLLWGPDDPLFPATRVAVGPGRQFAVTGLDRKHWSTAAPIRAIFKASFARAGLPYFNPHSFRKTLVQLGTRLCSGSWDAMQAWGQNLGHESLTTTFGSYGKIAPEKQSEIIAGLALADRSAIHSSDIKDFLAQVWRAAQDAGIELSAVGSATGQNVRFRSG